jgi:CheY-like chemotaxis protein
MMAPNFSLLLVDDEQDFVVITRLLLESEGFAVTTAMSGEEALVLVRGGVMPDLVLLDHRMPGLTGSETLARLRASGVRSPAVLVSARHNLHETAAADGFDAALAKPFAVDALVALVYALLGNSPL